VEISVKAGYLNLNQMNPPKLSQKILNFSLCEAKNKIAKQKRRRR